MDSAEFMTVTYRVEPGSLGVEEIAADISVEQTVEVTEPLWRVPGVEGVTVGAVESIGVEACGDREVRIRFPASVVGDELTQVLNVLYGNISMKPGIRAVGLDLTEGLAKAFRGPLHGIDGLRDSIGARGRPLVVGALKPLGRPIEDLARFAGEMAAGGIDVIKDDHGITDQDVCPFERRVEACVSAVERGAQSAGGRCLYFPTVTGPADQVIARAMFAKAAGAGGLLISPLVAGLDFVRCLSIDTGLPVMAHPALAGAFFAAPGHGISHDLLLGTLMRLAGSDLVIFPTWGGRFPFTRDECRSIDVALKRDFHGIKAAFPVPAGGLTLDRLPEQREVYGGDSAFLIGSALYERSDDLRANAAYFRSLVEKAADKRFTLPEVS